MWKRRNNNVKLYETFRDFSVSVLRKCYSEIIQIDCAKHLLAEIDQEEGKEPVFEKQDQLIPKVLEKLRIPGEENTKIVYVQIQKVFDEEDREKLSAFRLKGEDGILFEGEVMAFTSSFVFLCFRDITLQEKYRILEEQSKIENQEVRPKVFVRTFGYFDVFVNDTPVAFKNPKAKELLALLVDHAGGFINSEEAAGLLWGEVPYDESVKAKYRKTAYELRKTLRDLKIDYILCEKKGQRGIDRTSFECDYFQLLDGDKKVRESFADSYMKEYDWAQETLADLLVLTKENDPT